MYDRTIYNWVAIATGITSIVATVIAIGTFFYTWYKDSEEINVAQANKISAWIDNDEEGEAKRTEDMKFRPFAVWCGWAGYMVTVARSSLPQVRWIIVGK